MTSLLIVSHKNKTIVSFQILILKYIYPTILLHYILKIYSVCVKFPVSN